MTIRLSWPSQASKALTSIEIYRKVGHSATLDINNPGTPTATVAGDATQYVEDVANLTEKTVYTYWIAAVKGTERLFSAPIVQGFFLDTGPGPQKLLMGDWYAGYFGVVSNQELAAREDIIGAGGGLTAAQAAQYKYAQNWWYKFVYKGRIVYYPNVRTGYAAYADTYNAGMAYGIDGVGPIVPTGANPTAGVPQTAMFTKNGYKYRVRLPYGLDYSVSVASTDYDNGEFRNTFARLFATNTSYTDPKDQGKFASLALLSSGTTTTENGTTAMVPLYTPANALYCYGYNPTAITYAGISGQTFSMFFVLELVLP